MAGFLNTALPSDDEEDDDYNPAADNTAEREDLPQTGGPGRGGASRKRRRGAAIAATAGNDDADDGGDDGDDDDDGNEAAEASPQNLDPSALAKQAKVASLWQQINARAAANGSATQRPPSSAVNLAALCRSNLGAKKPKRADQDAIWMRNLGLLKRPTKPADVASSLRPGDAEPGVSNGLSPPQPQPLTAAAASGSASPLSSRGGTPGPVASEEEKRALAAAALAAARDTTTAGSRLGKVAVTEVRRFAGRDIQVTMHVDKDSKEAQKAAARAAAPPPPPTSSGLDAILAEIDKKKKVGSEVSVLDKTKADWSEYKAANTEVDEELETYKKSGDQYLDKQNFLKRAELREYEKERDLRLASDGYAALPQHMARRLGDLMRIIQERLPWVEVDGRRIQADDSPARYALRVSFNCLVVVNITSMPSKTSSGTQANCDKDGDEELQAQATLMVRSALERLGGPLLHEGSLTVEEKTYIARLATAGGSEEVQRLVKTTPAHVLALYMLQAQYDIELRIIKWVLHYVGARCAKEAYVRARYQPPRGPPGASVAAAVSSARTAWLSHSTALGKLDAASSSSSSSGLISPLSAFMVAEARSSSEGATKETLELMKKAAMAAERRGDDLMAWLARLNVAQLLIHGGQGRTFLEEEVLAEIDAAAAQRASVEGWGGTVLLESRCRTLKDALAKSLQEARELRQKQLAEAGSGSEGEADSGRLPSIIIRDQVGTLTPVALPHRECAGCKRLFDKALMCGKCKQAWYCGRECQVAHWRAGHKNECAALANAAAVAAAGRTTKGGDGDDGTA
ncbi:hypothetical protein VOLCADRAFT_92611 [Volvox carteri f. nagariensis]|uniref:MYND-type domain-containing protein n=1 Tax=Volvox carteri f. nagariensis TaxID=3068 RepID=D8U036_VOLCA|nr:uncharacterized protein VOLCADRAFT_92611 [Volvox carteri f. nagariensis]EFJ46869.1 hypothetical protein VOLCADRAFT_92611 [Volvox carteri f. nagariensis]|eukprot:XP_002952078.1 hypothetical protein VOLCADRAFT_92611 [Volvox carteri f. nagariensis]